MMNQEIFVKWNDLLSSSEVRVLVGELVESNPADIAEFFQEIEPHEALLLFRCLPKDNSAEVFSFLDTDLQEEIVASVTREELLALVERSYLDDTVDLLSELPANLVGRVLSVASAEKRETINRFLNYEEDSAGSVMTAEYLSFKESMRVSDAMAHVRAKHPTRETVYVGYCIDETRRLLGVIDLVDLLFAAPDATVGEIMNRSVIFAYTADDRESVAEKIAKYDFLALPIVDAEERLVGIVTVDDALDVVTREATEDIERMAALHPSDEPYLKSSVWGLFKNRIFWLFFLMLSGMISGAIMGSFEALLATAPLLVTFVPMLTGTGGNAGAQSATLVVRGMSLSEIEPSDWLRVLWKEIRVSLLVGVSLGALNYARVLLFYPNEEDIQALALVLGLSMLFTVFLAKSVGCLLPIVAKKLGADPAVMASPLVTTIVDSLSIVIFFCLASALLF